MWRWCYSNGVWLWLNMLWGWILNRCRKFWRLPLQSHSVGLFLRGLMLHTMGLYVTFMSWVTFYLWIKKHLPVISIYLVPWNTRPISFFIAIVHFGLSVPFIRRLYSWGFPVSGKTNTFIWPGWIFTSPFVLLVCAQSSTVLCIVYAGTGDWVSLCG